MKISADKVNYITIVIVVIGFLLGLCADLMDLDGMILPAGGVVFAGLIFHYIFYRCPYCKAYMGVTRIEDFTKDSVGTCPKCGRKIS